MAGVPEEGCIEVHHEGNGAQGARVVKLWKRDLACAFRERSMTCLGSK